MTHGEPEQHTDPPQHPACTCLDSAGQRVMHHGRACVSSNVVRAGKIAGHACQSPAAARTWALVHFAMICLFSRNSRARASMLVNYHVGSGRCMRVRVANLRQIVSRRTRTGM